LFNNIHCWWIHFVKWVIPTISACSRWSQGGTYFGNALLAQGGAKVQLFWECLAPRMLPSVKDLQEFLYVSVSWEKGKEKKKRVAISKYKMKNPSCGDGKIPLTKVSSKFTRKFLVGLLCATPPPRPPPIEGFSQRYVRHNMYPLFYLPTMSHIFNNPLCVLNVLLKYHTYQFCFELKTLS
jgi:hypothetical protein